MAIVGEVKTLLTGDASGLKRELEGIGPAAQKASVEATGAFSRFGAKTVELAAGIAFAREALTLLKGAVHLALAEFEKGESISKLSQSLGIATKDLTVMSAAAKLADTDVYTLGMSVGILSKHMVGGISDGSKFTALVEQLGIKTKDASGGLRDTWEVLGDIGDLFEKLPDGATKTGLSMEFLGRGGKAWIPVLNEGRAGLQQLRDTLDQIGAGPIPGFAKSSERLMDTLKLVELGARGVQKQVAAALLPVMQDAANGMLDWEKANNKLIATRITDFVKELARAVKDLGPAMKQGLVDVKDTISWLSQNKGALEVLVALAVGAKLAGGGGAALAGGLAAANVASRSATGRSIRGNWQELKRSAHDAWYGGPGPDDYGIVDTQGYQYLVAANQRAKANSDRWLAAQWEATHGRPGPDEEWGFSSSSASYSGLTYAPERKGFDLGAKEEFAKTVQGWLDVDPEANIKKLQAAAEAAGKAAEGQKAKLDAIVQLREADLKFAQRVGLADDYILGLAEQIKQAKLAALDAEIGGYQRQLGPMAQVAKAEGEQTAVVEARTKALGEIDGLNAKIAAKTTERQVIEKTHALEIFNLETATYEAKLKRIELGGTKAGYAGTLAAEMGAIMDARGGSTFAQRLGMAKLQDEAERAGLVSQRDLAAAEYGHLTEIQQKHGLLSEEQQQESNALAAQVDYLDKMVGLLDEAPRHARALKQEFLNIADILDNQVSTALTGILMGTGHWQDAGKSIGQAFVGELIRSTIKEKHIFDGQIKANLLEYLPGVGKEGGTATGTNFVSGLLSKLPGLDRLFSGGGTGAGAVGGLSAGEMGPPTAAAMSSGGTGAGAAMGGWVGLIMAGATAAVSGGAQIAGGKTSPGQNADVARSVLAGFSGSGPFIGLTNLGLGLNSTISRSLDAFMTGGISEILQGISDALGMKGFFGIGQPPTGEHVALDNVRDVYNFTKTGMVQYTPGWQDHSIIGRSTEDLWANGPAGKGGYLFDLLWPLGKAGGVGAEKGGAPGTGVDVLGGAATALGFGAFFDPAHVSDSMAVVGQFTNSFINNQRLLGHSVQQARDDLLKFASVAGVDLPKALGSLEQELVNGNITSAEYAQGVADVTVLFDKLPLSIDTTRLALEALNADGTANLTHFNAVVADLQAFFEQGIPGALKDWIKTGSVQDAGKSLAQAFSDTFVTEFAKQLIEGPLSKDFTAAIADAEKAAEAYGRGDKAEGDRLLALARQEFLSGKNDLLTGASPVINEIRTWNRSLGLGGGINGNGITGLIDQGPLFFDAGGSGPPTYTTPGMMGASSASTADPVVNVLTQIRDLLQTGGEVILRTGDTILNLDSREIARGLQRAETRGRVPGVTTARMVGRRG